MTLKDAFAGLDGDFLSESLGDLQVNGLHLDSRKIKPGDLFVCMPSPSQDSHAYLAVAREAGAVAALVHRRSALAEASRAGYSNAVYIAPEQFQTNLWQIAKRITGGPTHSMKCIGVTGTNGKTTVAWLLHQFGLAFGKSSAYLGTLGVVAPNRTVPLANTTPYTVELYNELASLRDQGVDFLAMEVSSHALAQQRADGLDFDSAIFTNLSQDHLDFHGTMEDYANSKLRLFTELPKLSEKPFRAAINVGDATGQTFANAIEPSALVPFQISVKDSGAHWTGIPVSTGLQKNTIQLLEAGVDRGTYDYPLAGGYNHENVLAAVAGLIAAGYELGQITPVLSHLKPVPGRFESVPVPTDFAVIVDYAHTPDALEKLLDSVRLLCAGRVITVFGCGGDRDRTKRPLMGQAASQRSDLTVITSDNPRTENPNQIISEIVTGAAPNRTVIAIVDRAEAIRYALTRAEPGDVVVIAGKGHENYQIIGTEKLAFDDRTKVIEFFES